MIRPRPLSARMRHLLFLIQHRGGSWAAADGWHLLSPGEMRGHVRRLVALGYLRAEQQDDGTTRYFLAEPPP